MAQQVLFNQPSFASGEIAPYLYGRVDQELYYIGLRTCRNFIVRQYGGASNRGGTYFVGEVKDSSKPVRLIPFSFNETQTYIIELGHLYARFIANGGQVLETAKNITAITQANPGVITSAGHGYSNGDDVYISGIVYPGPVELNGRTVRVKNVAANTFEITDFQGNNISTAAMTAYTSGGTVARVYTVATPWDSSDIFEINYAAKNDVLTVLHPDYYPRDMTRTGNTAWTINNFGNVEGPFQDKNAGAITITASGVTGSVTLTASAALFDAGMVGELFYIEQEPTDATKTWEVGKSITSGDIRRAGANYYQAANTATTGTVKPDHLEGSATDGDNGVTWNYLHSGFGIAQITGFTNSTTVTATVINRLPNNVTSTATTIWAKAAWSASQGYPSAAAYHKQRFVLGGTPQAPNRSWYSGVGARAFFGKSNPILADESFKVDLDTTEVEAIRHFIPLKQLIALTNNSGQLINGQNNVLDATSPPVADVQEYSGSAKVKPLVIGNTALFVEDTGDIVRSLNYELDSDSFTGIDLTARSPHLFEQKTIVDWTFQRRPLSVVWVVQDDGSLLGFTYMKEQKFYAWHRHDTDGTYKSVATIREGRENATYQVVSRTINGVTKQYIEKHASRLIRNKDARNQYFVDCGLSYDGRNTGSTTITISGGSTWDSPEVLTLTASASIFNSTDVGNQITFWYTNSDGQQIALRLNISAYSSGTVVSAVPTKPLPVAYQNVARTDWEFGKTVFSNFSHLAGKDAAVLADGAWVKEKSFDAAGKLTLDTPAAVVHGGLGYVSDLETLDLAQPAGQTKAKTTNVPRLFVTAQETVDLWAATNAFDDDDIDFDAPDSKFMQHKPRSPDIGYDLPIPPATELFEILLNSSWSNRQRVCIRNVAPTAITINCITPEAVLGYS